MKKAITPLGQMLRKSAGTLALAATLAVGLNSCNSSKATDASKSAAIPTQTEVIPVQVMLAETADLNYKIVAGGQFSTNDESMLSFKIGGVIDKILVREGDAVKAGQVLATLNLTEIETQVQQAEQGLKKAKRDAQRAEALYKDSVATLEQYQNAQTQLEVAQQQLTGAIFNKQYAQIRATTSGYVLRKMANVGQVVSPGTPVFQTNGANEAQWVLKVGVSDRDWGRVRVGDVATISIDAMPGKTLEGKVVRKAEQADAANGSLQIEILIPDGAKAGLASGLYGKATLLPAQKEQLIKVPYQALLDGDGQEAFVFIIENGKAHKHQIHVADLGDTYAWVSGLKPNDSVVIQGSAYLTEGSLVKVTKQ